MDKTIIVFTGAGISADSGIETFRGNGLWDKYKIEDVASPEGFENNPQLVWTFYKTRHDQLFDVVPNDAHFAIVDFEEKITDLGYKFILATQNVDRLHLVAGSQNVIEMHGNLYDVKCSHCDFISYNRNYWKHTLIPTCPQCGNYLRPNIVWFGEQLPEYVNNVYNDSKNCHAILVIGTSCQVYPAANLVVNATRSGALIYECNLEQSVYSAYLSTYQFFKGKAKNTVEIACNKLLNNLINNKYE